MSVKESPVLLYFVIVATINATLIEREDLDVINCLP